MFYSAREPAKKGGMEKDNTTTFNTISRFIYQHEKSFLNIEYWNLI